MWATRFWWMLKSLGFDNVAVLDGGWDKWKAEGRAVESGPAKGYPPATFSAKPRAGYFVDKHQVLVAGGERDTVVVNALNAQLHNGLEPSRYGRPGHIPGSCNVSAATLVDPNSTGSVTTSSRSMMARWANGRPTSRCRSRLDSVFKRRGYRFA